MIAAGLESSPLYARRGRSARFHRGDTRPDSIPRHSSFRLFIDIGDVLPLAPLSRDSVE